MSEDENVNSEKNTLPFKTKIEWVPSGQTGHYKPKQKQAI